MDVSRLIADDAAEFLRSRLGPGAGGVELLAQGAWTRAFGFTVDGRELVIRFGAENWAFEMDRRAAGFASPALPVPEVVDIGRAFGGWYAISTRARGDYLEDLDETAWRAVLPAVQRALAAMRDVDLTDTSGYGSWAHAGDARFATWRDTLLAIAYSPPEIVDRMGAASATYAASMQALAAVAPLHTDRHLLHGDLLHRNVLAAGDRLTAVLDWQCSLYGDLLYEYAWLEFWSPWHPGLAAVLPDISLPDVPDREARMRACMIAIGCNHLRWYVHVGDRDELAACRGRLLELID